MAGNRIPDLEGAIREHQQVKKNKQNKSGSGLGCFLTALFIGFAGIGGWLYMENKHTVGEVRKQLSEMCSLTPTSAVVDIENTLETIGMDGVSRPIYPDERVQIKEIRTDEVIHPTIKDHGFEINANVAGLQAANGDNSNERDLNRVFYLFDVRKEATLNANKSNDPFIEKYVVEVNYYGCIFDGKKKVTQKTFYLQFYKYHYEMVAYIDELIARTRPKQALAAAERAAKIYPEEPIIQNKLGIVYSLNNVPNMALLQYKKALELHEKYLESNKSYKESGKGNALLSVLNYNVGVGYINLNQCRSAIPFFEKAVELDKENSSHREMLNTARQCASRQ